MSNRKFLPYEQRKDINAKRKSIDARYDHPPGPSSYYNKRDVHPQFSEPEEYRITVRPHNSSYQQPIAYRNESNSGNKLPWKKTKSLTQNPYEQMPRSLSFPLHQPLPTFRQYISEVESDNEEMMVAKSICGNEMKIERSHGPPTMNQGANKTFSIKNSEEGKQSETIQYGRNKKALVGTRVRHVIGTVDQVIRWHKMTKHSEMELHFEVAGILESTINKGSMQLLLIRSESGHILQGVFYTIDRELPVFSPGTIVTATGNMIGSNKIQIFDANRISKDDFIAVQRLAFLSQRALEEYL